MNYEIKFTKQAKKDLDKMINSKYRKILYNFLLIIEKEPFIPPYEKLIGLENTYSRRINIQHRLVYQICEEKHIIKIVSTWSHYDNI